MMIQHQLPVLRKFSTVWLVMLAGLSMITACGGGGGGSSPSSANAPAVTISSPTGTYFKEGENIAFSGSATDVGGTQLTGSALVWTSNIDGQIGTSETLITSTLSPGDHNITLQATDSAGVTANATLPTITVAKTRFIKIGALTTGVPDASNAFDGDIDTAASIMTPDTEFIYFKAYLGSADTFLFKMKVAASTLGSKLALQGLTTNGDWQPVSDISLNLDTTDTIKISNAQNYKDIQGYINLRVQWEGGDSGDVASILEIWRIDPVYAGTQTQGVNDSEAAFDGSTDTNSSAKIIYPWGASDNYDFLHFKAYVGHLDTFIFRMLTNSIANDRFLTIDVEASPGNWTILETLPLNSTSAKTITVTNVQPYLDEDGYISLRARWVGYGIANQLEIYEISRIDPFFIGPKTVEEWIQDPGNAVDGNPDSYANIYYLWGEAGRHDFLQVESYIGDASISTLSIKTAPSTPGTDAVLIVEGELEEDNWEVIERIALDAVRETTIEPLNPRRYNSADGILSLRVRWISSSPYNDAYIYEISGKTE